MMSRVSAPVVVVIDNATFLPTEYDGTYENDPIASIEIKNKSLRITTESMGTGSYTETFVFRYQHNNMELIGYDATGVQRSTGESSSVSINYSTGMAATTHQANSSAKAMKKAVRLSGKPLITIDKIGLAESFKPEIPLPD